MDFHINSNATTDYYDERNDRIEAVNDGDDAHLLASILDDTSTQNIDHHHHHAHSTIFESLTIAFADENEIIQGGGHDLPTNKKRRVDSDNVNSDSSLSLSLSFNSTNLSFSNIAGDGDKLNPFPTYPLPSAKDQQERSESLLASVDLVAANRALINANGKKGSIVKQTSGNGDAGVSSTPSLTVREENDPTLPVEERDWRSTTTRKLQQIQNEDTTTNNQNVLLPRDTSGLLATPFVRGYQKIQWEESFKALVLFKQRYGHCRVPHNFKQSPALAGWVSAVLLLECGMQLALP